MVDDASGKLTVNDLPGTHKLLEFDPPLQYFSGSDPMLVTLGTFLLWIGWYGFNCGSVVLVYGKGTVIGRVAINTTLAPASASLVCFLPGHFGTNICFVVRQLCLLVVSKIAVVHSATILPMHVMVSWPVWSL